MNALFDLGMKLRQFGRLQVGRLLGTVANTDGRYKAWVDLLERCYFMRAEINALTKILLDKGLVTDDELEKRFEEEYRHYISALSSDWPEVEVTSTGIVIHDVEAFGRRAKAEAWPP